MEQSDKVNDRAPRILTEASGGLTASYLLAAIAEAGACAVASDITNLSYAEAFGAESIQVPKSDASDLWDTMAEIVSKNNINIVIPSLDETLLGWSERKDSYAAVGCDVIISPQKTIEICQDKWKTYDFFVDNNIPTPATSLNQIYPLVKPRDGRGGKGISIPSEPVDMANMISQELLTGVEYTIDVLFDHLSQPVYIVPRKRVDVVDGKSTKGVVVKSDLIEGYIHKIAKLLKFIGPINFQCFVDNGQIHFLEINPRVAGGMALGFAASENWVRLIIHNILKGRDIEPKQVKYGMSMLRYYGEHFVYEP